MRAKKQFKEEQQLDLLQQQEFELAERQKASAEAQIRLEKERREQACTIPPCEEVRDRESRKRHEAMASRGEIANQLRTQNHSLFLLFLLITATATLIWWGLRLMQGP